MRTILYDYALLGGAKEIESYMSTLQDATKDIDVAILINNVGFGYIENFSSDTALQANEFVNTHINSYLFTSKVFLKRLIARQPKGAIINVSSNP